MFKKKIQRQILKPNITDKKCQNILGENRYYKTIMY